MRQATALWLASLVVLGGVVPAVGAATVAPAPDAAEASAASGAGATFDGSPSVLALQAEEDRPDPEEDTIGWENGYWHNESIDVDQSDGLSDEELEAFVGRSMARVEYIRDREFEADVPVSTLTRAEYREQAANRSAANASYSAWNNQVWEALLIVGEDTDVQTELGATLGASVAGFYSPKDDEIKIVTSTPESPTVDNATLVHELVHALQDQHYDLSSKRYGSATQDGSLASDGIVEGEANYVEDRYRERCMNGGWECVETPETEGGEAGGSPPNLGVLLTLLQPYSDGPAYVHELYETGGWDAVERKLIHPPNSTEQTIHRTDEKPVSIAYEHNATDGWEPYPYGENGSDTVGEASLYAMAYYQDRQVDLPGIDYREVANADGEYDTYNYSTEPTAGWANDRVFPYHRGTGNDSEHGYVWVTKWDTAEGAAEFEEFYRSILDAHDAERLDNGTYVVEDGRFADAFHVEANGTRVTIVNGPTPGAIESIRPGIVGSAAPNGTATTTADAATTGEPTTAAETETTDEPATGEDEGPGTTAGGDTDDSGTTGASSPGFGLGAALAALLAGAGVALLAGRRTGRRR
jgi:hypothetical protein